MVIKPLEQLKEQVKQLEEEIENLKSELSKREEEIAALKIAQEKDRTTIKKLTLSNKKLSKFADLETEVYRLESELHKTTEELKTVRNKEVQGLQMNLRKTSSDLGHANNRCKSYEIEITELTRKINDFIKDLAESNMKRSKDQLEIAALQEELSASQAAFAQRKSDIENFSPSFQEYVRLKRQLHKSQQEYQELHQTVEKLSPRKPSETKLKLLSNE